MQEVILDTNVIVSALIKKNYPYLIVQYCIEGRAEICLSYPLLQEYLEVLRRPKFSKYEDFKNNADFFIARLSHSANLYSPTSRLTLLKDDPDNRLLELAQISSASFIITGNTKDFKMKKYMETEIVTPQQFWNDCK